MKRICLIACLLMGLSSSLVADVARGVEFFQRVVSAKEGLLFEGKTWMKGDRVCVEFEVGPELHTSIIKDGQVYNFSTASQAGTVAPVQKNSQVQFGPEILQSKRHLKAYLDSVNARVVREESYQGSDCFVYEYSYAEGGSQVLNRIWLWKKAFFPLKTEMRINNDDLVTIYYDAIRINANVDVSRFETPSTIRFYSE